jgi:nicotinamidase-related amidase
MSSTFHCPVLTYQQFTPRDGNGWHQRRLEFSDAHTAVVVMHAWSPPGPDQLPGWSRAVPYLNEIGPILRTTFPPLLQAIRDRGLPVFHVTGNVPASDQPALEVPEDPTWQQLRKWRQDHVFPGAPNQTDVAAGWKSRNLAPAAQPLPGETAAETSAALHAACQAQGINHLIYIGFAINWCLLMSPGGMVDMKRYGYLCSTVAEATTAVENAATTDTRQEYHQALWRVAVEFGFVFHQRDLIHALSTSIPPST